MFAVIVTGKEMRTGAPGNGVVGGEGDRYWICFEPEGWVPATSTRVEMCDGIPKDVMTFKTHDEAEKFASKWKGHPWWCSPKSHEIIEIKLKYKQVLAGYEPAH